MRCRRLLVGLTCLCGLISLLLSGVLIGTAAAANPASFNDPAKLPGIVVDDVQAEKIGTWIPSTHVSPYIGQGYIHDDNKDKGEKSVRFVPTLPAAGRYHVLLAYTPGVTRASNVPVTIKCADGEQTVTLDQRTKPSAGTPFQLIGTFRFEAGNQGSVLISNAGTDSHVIVDAVQFLAEADHPLASLTNAAPEGRRKSPIDELRAKAKITVPLERKPAVAAARTTAAQLDALVERGTSGQAAREQVTDGQASHGQSPAPPIDDEAFLRRASFDLIGRQPTPVELALFLSDPAADKRATIVDDLLASDEFGANWANYWVDTIAYRVPPPELTYLNYKPLRGWLTKQLNANVPWDQVVRELLTANGKIAEHPEATFIGYHQSNAVNLASETSRIFMGLQIRCAQCHDHPFDSWTRDQFHELAAFFARTQSKLSQNDGAGTLVDSKAKGEYVMPDAMDPSKKGKEMTPIFLDGIALEGGKTDAERREQLAKFITATDNPWFAKAYVNRIWGRLLGHGFYEPVDNLGESQTQLLPEVHEALAAHFLATGYDAKDLLRLLISTRAYQRALPAPERQAHSTGETATAAKPAGETRPDEPFVAARAVRLRGDEVFSALATGIELPNITPPAVKPTAEVRFPPPPKSTRDIVAEVFGFDPSLSPVDIPRTMNQAMLMMNNEQLQAQINAAPESGTMLSKLLAESRDDTVVIDQLFRRVLARKPTDKELKLAAEHIAELKDRGAALEDLLWSLVNSAEFTSKR
jgi:hypothetical protein